MSKLVRLHVNAQTARSAMAAVENELHVNAVTKALHAYIVDWEACETEMPDESVVIYTNEEHRCTFVVIVKVA
jgi:hypothetical protein